MKIEGLKKDTAVWVRGYADGLGDIDFLDGERSGMIDCLCEEDILYMPDSDFRLDDPTQPQIKVPQFVADWYEKHKDNFYLNLHRLAWELIENLDEDDFVPKKALDSDFKRWYHKTETAIQTLINMHQFCYTVQKEKLYTVEIPNPNEGQLSFVLMRQPDGNVRIKVMHSSNLDLLKTDNDLQLTEKEIRKDFDWAWQWKKEVTE